MRCLEWTKIFARQLLSNNKALFFSAFTTMLNDTIISQVSIPSKTSSRKYPFPCRKVCFFLNLQQCKIRDKSCPHFIAYCKQKLQGPSKTELRQISKCCSRSFPSSLVCTDNYAADDWHKRLQLWKEGTVIHGFGWTPPCHQAAEPWWWHWKSLGTMCLSMRL